MSITPNQPEPWLRGSVADIPRSLQPVAHAFIAAREDIERAVAGIGSDELWAQPGGIASAGFHLAHLAGGTDRLLTYARGESLSQGQREALLRERAIGDTRPGVVELIATLNDAFRRGLDQLMVTDESALFEPRAVGRAQSPSTVIGLLFHAAEHASRHAGQVVTTAKLLQGLRTSPPQ